MSEKTHWEKVYTTKQASEVSWTQETPKTSLEFIRSFNVSKSAPIIDIGGGDSNLVDFLLLQGYTDITVLDISEAALERAQKRLGEKASLVHWIASDITEFKPDKVYTVWHDRATFHFLTEAAQVEIYLRIAHAAIDTDGFLCMGTFSENGPQKCSGLSIKQYSPQSLKDTFAAGFEQLKCINEDHVTPFQTIQNFTFCSFRKRLVP